MQTQQDHVAGPWKAVDLDGRIYINPDTEVGEFALIARVHRPHNVNVIAAAPQLLEALEEIIAELDARPLAQGEYAYPDTGGMALARAAISKARAGRATISAQNIPA